MIVDETEEMEEVWRLHEMADGGVWGEFHAIREQSSTRTPGFGRLLLCFSDDLRRAEEGFPNEAEINCGPNG